MAEKRIIVVVESTAAMGPYWDTIQMDYLHKIIRCFGGNESTGQKPYVSNVEFALVIYNTHVCYSGILVQRTGWTRDPDVFLRWVSVIPFCGDGFNNAAIAEGLSEALMMFPLPQSGGPTQQNVDMHMHCILVAASNPYPLQTQVYVPQLQSLEQGESMDTDSGNQLYDAEAVAKVFPQFSISLSVICPKQLPKVEAIYNAGKRKNSAVDPPVDAKTTHFLVLISEGFREACVALNRSGTNLPSNQIPIKVDVVNVPPITGPPPTSLPSVNGSITNRQPMPAGNVTSATVKVEPVPVTSMVTGSAYPHNSSVPHATSNSQGVPSLQTSSVSQDIMTSNENAQDTKPIVSMLQPLRPVSLAQANVNDAAAANIPLSQQAASAKSKYTRVWEGSLSGLRHGQPVFITKLEGYRRSSASETLAANWPPVMHIIRLISQDHMNNKQFVGMANFLVFRAMNPHGFLGQLQEKKLDMVVFTASTTTNATTADAIATTASSAIAAAASADSSHAETATTTTAASPASAADSTNPATAAT